MLDALRRFLSDLASPDALPATAEDEQQIAVAALLVHLVLADGVVEGEEKQALERVLADHYALDPEAARELVREGREREEDAIDFYTFTSLLKRSLNETGRREVVQMMWEVVYADGAVGEIEDNVIWRVADLLGVSTRERVEIKQRIRERGPPVATE